MPDVLRDLLVLFETLPDAAEAWAVLTRSDVTGEPPPGWYLWAVVQIAHGALGAAAAAYLPRPLAGTLFALWAAKEVATDMPNGEWAPLVVADSLLDLTAALVGAMLVLQRRRRRRGWGGLTR